MFLLSALAIPPTASLPPVTFRGVLAHPARLVVKADAGVKLPFRVLHRLEPLGLSVVEVPAGKLQNAWNRLEKWPGVRRIEPDRAAKLAYTPNDPRYPDQWAPPQMRVPEAWDRSLGSNQAVVAIMDTGVNVNHEDLAPNVWSNPGEIPGNGVDDDGNGYVDDVVGWDFDANDPVPNDPNGHGTACAGIAAAVGDNGLGGSGIAPRARIMALKAARDDGYFFLSATLPAYVYAADNGARVLSMSFYSDSLSPAEGDAIAYCLSKNCLPVAAAGNAATSFPFYPGAYEEVLSVGASNRTDGKAGFSDWGSWVDVSAPGVELFATTSSGGYRDDFGGTSGATPQVAGIAALLIGAKPDATALEVRHSIEDTAKLLTSSTFGEWSNYGRVDAAAALSRLLDGTGGRKATKARWISPLGGPAGTVGRVYGRSLDSSDILVWDGRDRRTPSRTRDYADVPLNNGRGIVTVTQQGIPILKATRAEAGLLYPLTEGSANSSGKYLGGFADTLARDRLQASVTRRNDERIQADLVFRMLKPTGPKELVWWYWLSGAPGGATLTVEVYDWASASYPYGNWVTLWSGPAKAKLDGMRLTFPDPARYVDYEGTVYLRARTTAVPEGAELRLDATYIKG